MGLSENSVPLNPMVLLIIIPIKWLFHWEYTQHFPYLSPKHRLVFWRMPITAGTSSLASWQSPAPCWEDPLCPLEGALGGGETPQDVATGRIRFNGIRDQRDGFIAVGPSES